jgi:sarcosine oxidase
MARTCDFVVVGLGAMGCGALAQLAGRGRVIGLERTGSGHLGGSSHGESRILRLSNFENPAYGPLVCRALEYWRAMERAPGELFSEVGVLEAGPADGALMTGTRAAARAGGFCSEVLTAREAQARWPALSLPKEWEVRFQDGGGYLRPDLALSRLKEIALATGKAETVNAGVARIREAEGALSVVTDEGEVISTGAVVVTTGPWIADLIPALRGKLALTRQVVGLFAAGRPQTVAPEALPVFCFDHAEGFLYGFPDIMGRGVKAAFHNPGKTLARPEDAAPPLPSEVERIRALLERLAGPMTARPNAARTCIYTSASDQEFIVDRDPDRAGVVFASACAGHGFKFAPAIGEMLADLACGARGGEGPFRLARPGLG